MRISFLSFAVRFLIVVLCPVALAQQPAAGSSSANPWQDQRLRQWSREINDGQFDIALKHVEEDLVSAAPHPFDVDIWCRLHQRQHDVDAAFAASSPALQKALGGAPHLYALDGDGKWGEAEQYALTLKPEQIHGSFVYAELQNMAIYQSTDFTHALDWSLRALRTGEPNYLVVWRTQDAMEENLPFRAGVKAALDADPALASSLTGRFLQHALNSGGIDPGKSNCQGYDKAFLESLIVLIRQWLVAHPGDAGAESALATQLQLVTGDQADISGAIKDSLSSYPELPLTNAFSNAVHDNFAVNSDTSFAEGLALSRRWAALREADPPAADAMGVVMAASTLRKSSKCGATPRIDDARKLVEAAVNRIPAAQQAPLFDELAELDLAEKDNPAHFAQAAEHSRRAVALKDTPDHRETLMRALLSTKKDDDAAEARRLYDTGLQRFQDHPEAFFSTGDTVLERTAGCRERVANWNAALREKPNATSDLLQLVTQQGRCGDGTAASASLQRLLTLTNTLGGLLTQLQIVTAETAGMDALPAHRLLLAQADRGYGAPPEPAAPQILHSIEAIRKSILTPVPQTATTPPVSTVALSPAGNLLATGDGNGVVKIWSAEPLTAAENLSASCSAPSDRTCPHILRNLYAHEGHIASLEFSQDGHFLASTGRIDGKLAVWSIATGQLLWSLDFDRTHPPSVAIQPASGQSAPQIAIVNRNPLGWSILTICALADASHCRTVSWFSKYGFEYNSEHPLVWSADGSRLAMFATPAETLILRASDLHLLQIVEIPSRSVFTSDLSGVVFPDNSALMYKRLDASLSAPERTRTLAELSGDLVNTWTFPDGRIRFATVDSDPTPSAADQGTAKPPMVRLFETSVRPGQQSQAVPLASIAVRDFPAPGLSMIPATDRFAVYSTRTLQDARNLVALAYPQRNNGQPAVPALQYLVAAPLGRAAGVAFTPDNRSLVVVRNRPQAQGSNLDIWDLAVEGKPVASAQPLSAGAGVALDGSGFVTCLPSDSGEGRIRRIDPRGVERPGAAEDCSVQLPVVSFADKSGLAWFLQQDNVQVSLNGQAQPVSYPNVANGEKVKFLAGIATRYIAATGNDLIAFGPGVNPSSLCDARCPQGNSSSGAPLEFSSLAISSNGRYALASIGPSIEDAIPPPAREYGIFLLDLQTRSILRNYQLTAEGTEHAAITSVAFVADTTQFVAGTVAGQILLGDAARDGLQLLRPGGAPVAINGAPVSALAVSPDTHITNANLLAVASADGSVQLYRLPLQGEVETLARLDTFADSDWSVIRNSTGQYDAAHAGKLNEVLWVNGESTFQLDQMVQQYYRARLLPRLMGFEADPVQNSIALDQMQPSLPTQPEIVSVNIATGEIVVRNFRATDDAQVLLNGVAIPPKSKQTDANGLTHLSIGQSTAIQPGRINDIGIIAIDPSNLISSRPSHHEAAAPGTAASEAPAQFYAVISGVSVFGAGVTPLPLADADAREMAVDVARGATRLLGDPARVHIILLTSTESGKATVKDINDLKLGTASWKSATKESILAAIDEVKKSGFQSGDTFLMFLSGHGDVIGNAYAYPTTGYVDAPNPSDKTYISGDELTQRLLALEASHIVLLFDTCHAGQMQDSAQKVAAGAEDRQKATEDHQKEVEARVDASLHQNAYMLMGASSKDLSYDSTRLGHGFLTAGLLLSLRETPPGQDLIAEEWIKEAVKKTAEFAHQFGYEQNAPDASPNKGLKIARLTQNDIACIPDLNRGPLLGPPTVLDANTSNDNPLHDTLVNLLSQSSADAKKLPAFVYVEHPTSGAKRISAAVKSYSISGGMLHVPALVIQYPGAEPDSSALDAPVDASISGDDPRNPAYAKMAAMIEDRVNQYAARIWSQRRSEAAQGCTSALAANVPGPAKP